ncbi:MAG: RluA family pseudouridine synthase [Firmicutes bacterium]|nr:RluA family pseudouridine synthase [Bacillota bacterium]
MTKQIIIENELDNKKRIDMFLATELNTTRSQVQQLVKYNKVLVNDKLIKAGYELKIGDIVSVEVQSDNQTQKIIPQNIPLNILFEDKYILVIDKPQGLAVHPGGGATENTLANALAYHTPNLSSISGEERPGIVHRLDKDTSGVIVVAKTNEAHLCLSNQFSERVVTKTYLAIVEGVVKNDNGEIKTFLDRDLKDRKKMRVAKTPNSREAISRYRVLERFSSNTYLEFDILTGRTHQIRVHCKHIGHPVVGDKAYGYKKQKFNLQGQLLHASKLVFFHPIKNEKMEFNSVPPQEFLRILTLLQEQFS